MPTFWYAVQDDPQGARRALHAPNLPAALLELRRRGQPVREASPAAPPTFPREKPVSEADLLGAYRQLAAMLRGGTPLAEALGHLAAECPNPRLRRALQRAAVTVAEGGTLAEGLEQYPLIFRPEVVAVVEAAEAGGDVPEALDTLATHGDTYYSLLRRVSLPLIYPLLVCLVAASILSFSFTFIVPQQLSLFRELGLSEESFPLPTLIMMVLARWVPGLLWALSILGVVFVILYWIHRRTAAGRIELEYWRMRMPLLGQLAMSAAAARMCAALAMLLERRVPEMRALRLAGNASGSEVLAAGLRRAEAAVEQGGSITEGLREAEALPPHLLWRLSAGERSNSLPATCRAISRLYVDTTEFIARRAIAVIEPVAVLLLGLVVAGTVLGMFMPLVSIIAELSM